MCEKHRCRLAAMHCHHSTQWNLKCSIRARSRFLYGLHMWDRLSVQIELNIVVVPHDDFLTCYYYRQNHSNLWHGTHFVTNHVLSLMLQACCSSTLAQDLLLHIQNMMAHIQKHDSSMIYATGIGL
jgi:hypothetical protein